MVPTWLILLAMSSRVTLQLSDMSFSHQDAKTLLGQVAPELTPGESQAVRAVASHESDYGEGWVGNGSGSNNMGAIMTGETSGHCSGFTHGDSNPDEAFTACFKTYPTREAGMKDLVRVMLKSNVRAAANRGDLLGVARGMFDNHYYTGTSHDPEVNIERYHQALRNNLDSILASTGEQDAFQPKTRPSRGFARYLAIAAGLGILGYAYKSLSKGFSSSNNASRGVRGPARE